MTLGILIGGSKEYPSVVRAPQGVAEPRWKPEKVNKGTIPLRNDGEIARYHIQDSYDRQILTHIVLRPRSIAIQDTGRCAAIGALTTRAFLQ